MEFDFNKISIGDLIQIVLIIVFITQTFYLSKQTNFGRRSSQANLTEVWKKEFEKINYDALNPLDKNKIPDENQFNDLVTVLYKMHPYFKEKLLKPSDFSIMFVVLYLAIEHDQFRKTLSFKDNYLRLQDIFHVFNSDADVVMFFLSLPTTSMYEEIIEVFNKKGLKRIMKKQFIDNWVNVKLGIRIAVIFAIKIKRKSFFKLKAPEK